MFTSGDDNGKKIETCVNVPMDCFERAGAGTVNVEEHRNDCCNLLEHFESEQHSSSR